MSSAGNYWQIELWVATTASYSQIIKTTMEFYGNVNKTVKG